MKRSCGGGAALTAAGGSRLADAGNSRCAETSIRSAGCNAKDAVGASAWALACWPTTQCDSHAFDWPSCLAMSAQSGISVEPNAELPVTGCNADCWSAQPCAAAITPANARRNVNSPAIQCRRRLMKQVPMASDDTCARGIANDPDQIDVARRGNASNRGTPRRPLCSPQSERIAYHRYRAQRHRGRREKR